MCCARCAVELFEKSAPGCFGVIYMDIMMPRMNGWDAARTIRAMNRPDAEIVPIIAMSANAFSEDIMDSRLAGFVALCSGQPNKNNRNIAMYGSAPVVFMPKFIAHGGMSLYIITCVLTRVMNGAILSKLELQKKPRKPHENG